MSDINRVPIPYGSQQVSNKSKNVINKTFRIAVKLPQSNEDTCPEYNYKDELDAAKKRSSSKNIENGNMIDLFEDDDRDVMRIAMQMEEKYGKGVTSKKRHKGRKDDYADIGMGYDESDSFIDNTDGYDEIIPQNVSTVHGGFYINCGALEFKANEEEEEDSDTSSSSSSESNPLPKSGKRSVDLNDSDEEEDGLSEHRKKKLKVESGCNGMQKALKKKLFSPNKILKKKRSLSITKKTVKDLLKEKRVDLNMSVLPTDTDVDNSVLIAGKNNMENGKNLSNSITDAIESVVKASDKPVSGVHRISSQVTDELRQIASLPENLPNTIAEFIAKIKQSVAVSTSDNKFTDEMNSLLLSLEKKCKCLGKPSKMKVYEHLSYFMKIDKQILIQQCKLLTFKDEDKKIKSLLQKLKAEIDKVMPSIISNYEKECEAVLEKRTLLQLQNQEGGEERRRTIGRPKRKFQWNDQTKKFLKDTATIRKRSYLQQGHLKEKWEEELTTFLKNNVIHLWPEGWMTMTALTKVCNKLFNEPKAANLSANPKKENKNTATSNSTLPYPANVFTNPSVQFTKTYAKTEKPFDIAGKLERSGKEQTVKDNKESSKDMETDRSTDKKNNNGSAFFKVDYEKPQDVNQEVINESQKFQKNSKPKEQESKNIFKQGPTCSRSKDVIQSVKEVPKFASSLKPKECGQEPKDFVKYPSSLQQPKEFARDFMEVVELPSKKKEVKDVKFPTGFPSKDLIQEIKESSKFSNVNIIELDSANNFSNILPKTKPKVKNDSEFQSISILMNKNSSKSSEKNVTSTVEKQHNSNEESAQNVSDNDDIQNVMERLKNLQKMSSPLKTEGSSSSNTAFSQKALRSDIDLVTSSFQDEFQKQLLSALGNPSPSSSNYKCS